MVKMILIKFTLDLNLLIMGFFGHFQNILLSSLLAKH